MIINTVTKNQDRRGIALIGHAHDVVRELLRVPRIDTNLLFPNAEGDGPAPIRTAWDTAVAKAELQNFRFHDLRHSAASYLVMNGVSTTEIAKILGHRTLSMVMRYGHLCDEHAKKTAAALDARLFGGAS